MRRKLLLITLVLALFGVLFSPIMLPTPAMADDTAEVCLYGTIPDPLISYKFKTQPGNITHFLRPGVFIMGVLDGYYEGSYDGWCIEFDESIDLTCYVNSLLSDAPRTTPWCEIGYILTNYSPSTDEEIAAIQLAIWKYVGGGIGSVVCESSGVLEDGARDIYNDALDKSQFGPTSVVRKAPLPVYSG